MRITDLMDDYYDEGVVLPEAEGPTAERIKMLTLQKLGVRRRRMPVGLLAAAACLAALSVTAGAAAYTFRDAARTDVGLEANGSIPEYREYSRTAESDAVSRAEIPANTVEGANIELISTLCAGNNVTVYLAVSPVTQEMANQAGEAATEDGTPGHWFERAIPVFGEDAAETLTEEQMNISGGISHISMTEYDAENQTALLCARFSSDVYPYCEALELYLAWEEFDGREGHREYYTALEYGELIVPITPSNGISFAPDAELENEFLPKETAAIRSVELGASYISFTYEVRSFEAICEAYGEDAYFKIGDAYEGYYKEQNGEPRPTAYSRQDASVSYRRSWEVSLNTLRKTAFLTMKDGTVISLGDLPETTADIPDDGDTIWTAAFDLTQAVDLSQVESITLNDAAYPVQ